MTLLGISVGLSILGSLGGVIVASSFLLLGETIRVRLVPWLISYAVGTLVGVALLALVPEALSQLPARPAMLTMAAGILTSSCSRRPSCGATVMTTRTATCTTRRPRW